MASAAAVDETVGLAGVLTGNVVVAGSTAEADPPEDAAIILPSGEPLAPPDDEFAVELDAASIVLVVEVFCDVEDAEDATVEDGVVESGVTPPFAPPSAPPSAVVEVFEPAEDPVVDDTTEVVASPSVVAPPVELDEVVLAGGGTSGVVETDEETVVDTPSPGNGGTSGEDVGACVPASPPPCVPSREPLPVSGVVVEVEVEVEVVAPPSGGTEELLVGEGSEESAEDETVDVETGTVSGIEDETVLVGSSDTGVVDGAPTPADPPPTVASIGAVDEEETVLVTDDVGEVPPDGSGRVLVGKVSVGTVVLGVEDTSVGTTGSEGGVDDVAPVAPAFAPSTLLPPGVEEDVP